VQQQVHEEVVAHEAMQCLPVRPLEQGDQRVWVVAHDAVGLGHKVTRGARRGVAVAERQQVPIFPVRPSSPEKSLQWSQLAASAPRLTIVAVVKKARVYLNDMVDQLGLVDRRAKRQSSCHTNPGMGSIASNTRGTTQYR
jgi:hypothetical protein